jgi:MFS family permease
MWPLATGHAWANHVDLYDDGVYVAAAANFVRGTLPYRDFTLVHPPGIVLALAPVAWLSPATAYVAARWLVACVSAVTASLCGLGCFRAFGAGPALVAVVTYALQPDIAAYERGPFLEPFLNLGVMALFFVATKPPSRNRALWFGTIVGAMCCFKLLAIIWALPVMILLWPSWRHIGWAALAAIAVGLSVAAPFLIFAPSFIDMVVQFHLWRPSDGEASLAQRLTLIGFRLWAPLLFLGVGLVVGLARNTRLPSGARAILAGLAITVVALLSAKTFWLEYVSHLAAPVALAASVAAWGAVETSSHRAVKAAAIGLGVAAGAARVHWVVVRSTQSDRHTQALGLAVKQHLPRDSCIVALEPIWALSADQLPTGPIDSYGAQLVAAMQSGATGRDPISDVFATPASQALLRSWLERCPLVLWSGRGDAQATPSTLAFKREQFEQIWPAGDGPIVALRRRTQK